MSLERVEQVRRGVEGKSLEESLRYLADTFGKQAAFSTSFGMEDQVISHAIFSSHLPIRVFTLETGRHFPETHLLWQRTVERYGVHIEAFAPQAEAVEALMSKQGPYSFQMGVEARKACCQIRKVEPLGRALKGVAVWVTGIRSAQSVTRADMSPVEYDSAHGVVKFHPLLKWSLEDLEKAVAQGNIPIHDLHAKGYPSIGCQPCTRAVGPGEDLRSGRWWWEAPAQKECGLHVVDGRLVRAKKD